jgi:hypothetical protein
MGTSYIHHPINSRIVIFILGRVSSPLSFFDVDKGDQANKEVQIPSIIEIVKLFPTSRGILGIGSGIVLFEFDAKDPYKFTTTEIFGHWTWLPKYVWNKNYLTSIIQLDDDTYLLGTGDRKTDLYILKLSNDNERSITSFHLAKGKEDPAENIGRNSLILSGFPENKMFAVVLPGSTRVYLIDYLSMYVSKSYSFSGDGHYVTGYDTVGSFSTLPNDIHWMSIFTPRDERYAKRLDSLSAYMIKKGYLSKNMTNVVKKFL